MENFEVINPVRVVFGKEQWSRLPELLKAQNAKKVMVAYGGGSVKKIGLFGTIMKHLGDDFEIIEFGGIAANPEYTKLMEAVEIARAESVDFIIALGGGSVIDGVKFISGAIGYKGEPWDVLERKEGCVFDSAVPFGTILTIPATGSEVNSGAVVSRSEMGVKLTMGGPLFFPVFSFCDPTVVATLPKRQLANGIIDAYMHVLEQYLTIKGDNLLQERQAEAILSTLIEVKGVVENPSDYDLAANFMLCASHALNGNLRCGVKTDWTTHMIGHELTAKYGIDHARTLAIVGPRLLENQFDRKKAKLAQYGERVWGLKGDVDVVAQKAIEKTEAFFHELDVPTKLSEYSKETAEFPKYVSNIFVERNWIAMGEHQAITPNDVENILEASI